MHLQLNNSSEFQLSDFSLLICGRCGPLYAAVGTNALLANIDVKEAYRIIPIHPDDRPFPGLHWKEQVYIDCQLPFGLASAPSIFSALGKALKWVLWQRGVQAVVHYLDDFLFVRSPGTDECQRALLITGEEGEVACS